MSRLYERPDSSALVAEHARKLIVRADCLGVLPTPIDRLYEVAKVTEVGLDSPELMPTWRELSDSAKAIVGGILSRLRGAANLRKRVVFIAHDDTSARVHFVRSHELGHQVLPWQTMNPAYADNDFNLGRHVEDKFEIEANLFAGETIFQGDRFMRMARDYRPEFSSIFELARRHNASAQATAWQFVEVHDAAIAQLVFYPGESAFRLWKQVRSENFSRLYPDLTISREIPLDHEWALARLSSRPVAGETVMFAGGRPQVVFWEAYWNRHCLIVMLTRPALLRRFWGRRHNGSLIAS